jgi:hypothetical protein
LTTLSKHARLVLDIHSYRPTRGRIGTMVGHGYPMVILDYCPGKRDQVFGPGPAQASEASDLSWDLATHIGTQTKHFPLVLCSRLGDIRKEMLEYKVPIISIEFSFDMTDALLKVYARYVAEWVKNRFATMI